MTALEADILIAELWGKKKENSNLFLLKAKGEFEKDFLKILDDVEIKKI